MRAQIVINKFGTTQTGTGSKPPSGGILARRSNRDFSIVLDQAVTIAALIALMRTLRAIDGQMKLDSDNALPMTRQKMCLKLARHALSIIEKSHETRFMSDLEIFNPEISTIDVLPNNLTQLVELDFTKLDAPSALMKASAAKIKNLVLVGQNRSMRLCFLALPKDTAWPPGPPELTLPIDESVVEPICTWLTIAYEAALSIQAPIYQHGILKINSELRLPFQRVLNPITPTDDRPAHFRVLSVASAIGGNAENMIII